jgi:hypothetical protein
MSTKQENIPSEILDWMNESNFDSLQQKQQKLVLKFFSKTEFNDLHFASRQLKAFSKKKRNSKEFLLNEFDKVHPSKGKIIYFQNSSIFWKAAILLLLIGIGFLQFSILSKDSQTHFVAQTIHDTIVEVKNIVSEPLKIHDTILLSNKFLAKKEQLVSGSKFEEEEIDKTFESNFQPISDFKVLSIADLKAKPNQVRSGSVRYDSLVKQFQFVSL